MTFRKYEHLERLESPEVDGILKVEDEPIRLHIQPKIDGCNASIWYEDGEVKCGSRNNVLQGGLQGFWQFVQERKEQLEKFFMETPKLVLYGEWLVPHSIRHYQDDAWRKFYVFDIFDSENNEYLSPLNRVNIDGIRTVPTEIIYHQAVHDIDDIKNTVEYHKLDKYLCKDGFIGEGFVIKRYDFINKFGRYAIAKYVYETFKTTKYIDNIPLETKIVDKYLSDEYIAKEFAKHDNPFKAEGILFQEFIRDYILEIIKKEKYPTIDFAKLKSCMSKKVKLYKEVKKE